MWSALFCFAFHRGFIICVFYRETEHCLFDVTVPYDCHVELSPQSINLITVGDRKK